MSVVVAIKTLTGVVVAADKQVTRGYLKDSCSKVHEFEYSNSAIGTVGTLRDANVVGVKDELIPYKDILSHKDIDLDFVISKVVPELTEALQCANRVKDKNGVLTTESSFLFCTSKRIFIIESDFSVIEAQEGYAALGCGEEKVYGFLSSIENIETVTYLEAQKYAKDAIQKACDKDPYVGSEYDIVFLEDKK